MARQWCTECGLEGRAVEASVEIGDEPLCHSHARLARENSDLPVSETPCEEITSSDGC